MSQIGPPIPGVKTAFFFTLATAAVFGVAIVIANIKNKDEPRSKPSTEKHGYSVRGNNYSNCNCN